MTKKQELNLFVFFQKMLTLGRVGFLYFLPPKEEAQKCFFAGPLHFLSLTNLNLN
jgi:hypothetical protein